MRNFRARLGHTAIFLSIAALLGASAVNADDPIGPDPADIDTAVSVWAPSIAGLDLGVEMDVWEEEFRDILAHASAEQVLDVIGAGSYREVQNILRGEEPDALNGGAMDLPDDLAGTQDLDGIAAIGDLGRDLVYTPVVPCRIFDTRNDGDGGVAPAVGARQDYYVYGSGGLIAPQGGNASGCASPGGEPSAIAANFTVIPFAKGNIVAWPFGSAQPTASLVNYNTPADFNVANAAIIATGFGLARDLSVVSNFGQSHYIGDVLGYFYTGVLAANTVTSTQVQNESLTSADLGPNSVGQSEIQTNGVASAEIQDNTVTSADILNETITSADIGANAVGQSEIATGGVASAEVLDNSLTAADLATNSVTASEIATGAVASAEVLDNSLTANDLATNSVGAAEIATGAVGTSEIATNAVGVLEFNAVNFPDSTSAPGATLVAGDNYIMSSATVTPADSGKCIVVTVGQIQTDVGDTYQASYWRTARQVGAAAPTNDGTYGLYTMPVGRGYSTPVSATNVWDVTGGTTYRFGCYANAGGDVVGDFATCRVSWMCF